MSTVTAILLSLIGLVALAFGADALVRGSSRLAVHFGITPLVVGLTVVAYGTSAPEVVASLIAAVQGHSDVTVGNVLGSNVANTALILGSTAVLAPVLVARSLVRRELPLMVAATFLFGLFALQLELGRAVGVLFLVLLVLFNYITLRWARQSPSPLEGMEDMKKGSLGSSLSLTVIGLLVLVAGAHALVEGAVSLARSMGVSDFTIGVTLVAVGTSLPELATSFAAGLRNEADLVVGNIVGSNVFNIFGALGLSAAVRPIPIDQELFRFEIPALIAFTLAMVFFVHTGGRVSRTQGVVLLAGYVAFVLAIV